MEEKFNVIDGSGRQINIDEKDFEFVQKDNKIHDLKFNTKPTTFLKDALRRFVKSKSALVGGIIVGVLLLLSFIVPLCTPDSGVYNVQANGGGSTVEAELPPKLFNAGTGFWDGTIKRSHITYDPATGLPVGDDYREDTVSKLSYYAELGITPSEYGSGGSANLYNNNPSYDGILTSNSVLDLDLSETYTLSYEIAKDEKGELASYEYFGHKLYLSDGTTNYYLVGDKDNFSLTYGESISILDRLNENGYEISENLSDLSVNFLVSKNYGDNGKTANMLLTSFSLTSTSEDEELTSDLSSIGFKDGNEFLLKNMESAYWKNSYLGKSGFNITIWYCDFVFDKYEAVYGKVDQNYSSLELVVQINSGYMELDFSNGTEATTDLGVLKARFKILDTENCEIVEVVEQVGDATYNSSRNQWTGFTIKAKVWNYKKLGYSKMPRFIFGTDSSRKDFCKLMFTGLRSSLFLAIGVSLVNIIIGLIWGSISGYFGGWTDILMERFCDIISGLPSTVIITLCILYGREYNWGSASDVIALMIALFMTGWMGVSARTRTQFYRYKGREYVLASRTLGAKDGRLIFKHILPNSAGTIITGSILMIPSVIYTESSIAYLGLGLQNQVLFGVILSENRSNYKGETTYLLFLPTLIMMFLLVSFNLFGNGLRDAFNPQLKGGE